MYPEAGPSRPSGSYSASNSASRDRWEGGPGGYDRDGRDRDGYPPRADAAPGRGYPSRDRDWDRRPRPPPVTDFRSRTPSPPRRNFIPERDRPFDRDREREFTMRDRERTFDVRDRLSLEPGYTRPAPGPPPAAPFGNGRPARDWDRFDSRRGGDFARDRHTSLGPSPPQRRSPPYRGPPRNVRARTPPPYLTPRMTSGPRSSNSNTPSTFTPRDYRDGRDLKDERTRDGYFARPFDTPSGPGPSSHNNNSQISSPEKMPPRAPRSMRGSSSPVESKNHRPLELMPAAMPLASSSLEVKQERFEVVLEDENERDLEEGEVVSPVKPARRSLDDGPSTSPRIVGGERHWDNRSRSRWSPSPRYNRSSSYRGRGRNSTSPAKRPRSPFPGEFNPPARDAGWSVRGRSRSRSNPADRRRVVSDGNVGASIESPRKVSDTQSALGGVKEETPQVVTPNQRVTPAQQEEAPVEKHGEDDGNGRDIGATDKEAAQSALPEEPTVNDQDISMRTPEAEISNENESEVVTGEHKRSTEERIPKDQAAEKTTSNAISDPPAEIILNSPVKPTAEEVISTVAADQQPSSAANEVVLEESARTVDQPAEETPSTDSSNVSVPPAKIPVPAPSNAAADLEMPSGPQEDKAIVDQPVDRTTDIANPENALDDRKTPQTFDKVRPSQTSQASTSEEGDKADSIRRVTIAERRSIILGPTSALASPFGDRFVRRDPLPTGDSGMGSTDTETEAGPKTAESARHPIQVETVDEEVRQARLILAIKNAQGKSAKLDLDSIIRWNMKAAPTNTSRTQGEEDNVAKDDRLWQITQSMNSQHGRTAKLVGKTVHRELQDDQKRVDRLRAEYKQLEEEWKGHCSHLDSLMEKRGPPPAELYATPNAILPVVMPGIGPAPGLAPSTPIEESYGARGNRRRGVGDAVTTEAEFEAILAGLADTAAKDPNYRASKTTAVVPDMIPLHERKMVYDDDNDLVTDPLAFYDFKGVAEPIWTEEERAMFLRRYLAYPKQFGRISDGLPEKSASDCVLYYYRTKKMVDYKGMLASRRGDKKKKSLPIKKSGKSSALLADLNRQKPTINPSSGGTGPRSAITPAKNTDDTGSGSAKRGRQPKDSMIDGRRKKTLVAAAEEDESVVDSSAGPSRAGSETPSMALKGRMRLSVKANKRPRVSSVNGPDPTASPGTTSAATSPTVAKAQPFDAITPAEGQSASSPLATLVTTTPAGDLLPPVKRPGKKRKVAEPSDPSITPTAEEKEKDPNRANKRNNTNSYWSVEEKKKFKYLVKRYGTDIKAIAAEMAGKSERQVANFYDAHRADMGLDELSEGRPKAGEPAEDPTSAFQPAAYARSIYDVFPGKGRPPSAFGHDRPVGPRLGMFPSAEGIAAPTSVLEPAQPVSRSGGMRISALLNEDAAPSSSTIMSEPVSRALSPKKAYDTVDAASDGTVSEKDAEGGVAARPSSAQNPAFAQQSFARSTYDQAPVDRMDARYRPSTVPPNYETASWARHPETPSSGPSGGYFPPPPARASSAAPLVQRPVWDQGQGSGSRSHSNSHTNYTQQYPPSSHPAPAPHRESYPPAPTQSHGHSYTYGQGAPPVHERPAPRYERPEWGYNGRSASNPSPPKSSLSTSNTLPPLQNASAFERR